MNLYNFGTNILINNLLPGKELPLGIKEALLFQKKWKTLLTCPHSIEMSTESLYILCIKGNLRCIQGSVYTMLKVFLICL